jgi:hypothetical protein
MAWGGKIKTRMGEKERKWFLRNSHRSLPQQDNPHGVPSIVMKVLQTEGLSHDPVKFNTRLQALLKAYKSNGG